MNAVLLLTALHFCCALAGIASFLFLKKLRTSELYRVYLTFELQAKWVNLGSKKDDFVTFVHHNQDVPDDHLPPTSHFQALTLRARQCRRAVVGKVAFGFVALLELKGFQQLFP